MFYEVLEILVGVIDKRFNQESIKVPRAIEACFIKACRSDQEGETDDRPFVPPAVEILYAKDLDPMRLKRQMKMLPDLVRNCPDTAAEDTKFRTLANMLATEPLTSSMFSEIDKLVRIYLILPVTTATGERSFSALRRIKTYLRSSVTQQSLNNAMLIFVHKPEADALDLKAIASQFVSTNERHRRIFGENHN